MDCSIDAYDAGVVDEMDGVAVVCLTRLTSFKASSDQRSTFRTYMVCSISLRHPVSSGRAVRSVNPSYILAVDFFARLFVYHHELDAGRRRDGASVLVTETAHARALWLLYDDEPAI